MARSFLLIALAYIIFSFYATSPNRMINGSYLYLHLTFCHKAVDSVSDLDRYQTPIDSLLNDLIFS